MAWRCSKSRRYGCKACIAARGVTVIQQSGYGTNRAQHNHEPNKAAALARQAVGEMKRLLAGSEATPKDAQVPVISFCIVCLFCLFICINTQQQCIDHKYKSEAIPGCQRREHVPRWSDLHDNPIIIQHVKGTNAIAN